MRVINTAAGIVNKICKILSYMCMVIIGVLVLFTCYDVISGNMLKMPMAGVYEVSQLILSMLVFSAWAYTQTVHGHIHVSLFISKMPPKLRFICFSITSLVSTVIMGIASYAVLRQTMSLRRTGEITGTIMVPFWPFYAFEFVCFVIFTLALLVDTIKAITAIWNSEMADEIQAAW